MPFLNPAAAAHGGAAPSPPLKLDTKLLSLLLKVTIMVLLTTLFFVFVGVATALFLLHLSFAGAVHRHRHSRRADSSSGFSPNDLKKLLQFRFSDWANPHSQIDCPICLDGFRMGQWCRKLGGCGHFFHRKCIDSWLVRVPACPLCRCSVRLDLDGDDDDDDDRVHCVSSRNCEVFYGP